MLTAGIRFTPLHSSGHSLVLGLELSFLAGSSDWENRAGAPDGWIGAPTRVFGPTLRGGYAYYFSNEIDLGVGGLARFGVGTGERPDSTEEIGFAGQFGVYGSVHLWIFIVRPAGGMVAGMSDFGGFFEVDVGVAL